MTTVKRNEIIFQSLSLLALSGAILVLGALILDVLVDGWGRISWEFLQSFPSRKAEKAGVVAALWGSVWLLGMVALISLPLGVGAAVYLEEYVGKGFWSRLIEINLANLAGVPSIVYGILGLQIFVRVFALDRSLLAGALTMSLLILPVIVITAREAIRRVPQSIRDGAYALGATRWEVVKHHVLPIAAPGIFTGCILAFSRAIGETAPLITMGALTYVAFVPDGPMSEFTVLPIQAFNWISRPQEAFHANAAAAIIILLVVLLSMNLFAVMLRNKLECKVEV